jgi:hypothetical protein
MDTRADSEKLQGKEKPSVHARKRLAHQQMEGISEAQPPPTAITQWNKSKNDASFPPLLLIG